MRVATIQSVLNRRGILTAGRKGKGGKWELPTQWSRQTFRQMLMNRHDIGEHWEGGILIGVECPTFVDRETFEGVQKMFADEKEMGNGRPATKHLLCGWLRCKKCGRRHRTVTGAGDPAYVCVNYNCKLRKQVCRMPRVNCAKLELVVWTGIWNHLTQAELLLANARAYYDSLPSKSTTGKLEAELADVRSRMERTKRMVPAGSRDESEGSTLTLEDKQRIGAIEMDPRAAGSVMTLPAARVVEAGCRRIVESGAKLKAFEKRRPTLVEKLVDLKITYGDGEVLIEGKVPVPEAAAVSGARKCNSRVRADAEREREHRHHGEPRAAER
jgi:hypothetical protein